MHGAGRVNTYANFPKIISYISNISYPQNRHLNSVFNTKRISRILKNKYKVSQYFEDS